MEAFELMDDNFGNIPFAIHLLLLTSPCGTPPFACYRFLNSSGTETSACKIRIKILFFHLGTTNSNENFIASSIREFNDEMQIRKLVSPFSSFALESFE